MSTEPRLPPSCAQRFRPTRVLAQGGFGTVWLAQQISLDRPVAVKVLHGEVLSNDTAVQRFLNEARVTAQVTHPNIVVLVDHDVEDGVPWIAYEYVPGKSLRERIAGGALPWREACAIAIQIASALEAAHARGVLHRDIKPDNVIETGGGSYKVADFGIARAADGKALTAAGEIVGTPAYLSPVQLRGEVPGPESDIYALGITLFEMLAGQVPFEDENVVRLLQLHLMQEPPHLSDRVEGLPRELDRIVQRALAKKREDRFDTVAELRTALERVLAGPTAPRTVSRKVPRITAKTMISPAPPGRSRLPLVASVILACAAVLAVTQVRPPPPAQPSGSASSAAPAPATSAAPELPILVRQLHIAMSDTGAMISLDRDRGVPLGLALRPAGFTRDEVELPIPASPLLSRTLVWDLHPDTDYELSIRTPGGALLIDRHKVRTRPRSAGNRARQVTARDLLDDPMQARDALEDALDTRAEPIIAAAIQLAPGAGDAFNALAGLARMLRSPSLVELCRGRYGDLSTANRAAVLSAMVSLRHPDAEELILQELPRMERDPRDEVMVALERFQSAKVARALAASLEHAETRKPHIAGVTLAQMDAEVATRSFNDWLSENIKGPKGSLALAAIRGLGVLPGGLVRALVEHALTSENPSRRLNALWTTQYIGPACARAVVRAMKRFPEEHAFCMVAAYLGATEAVPGLLTAAGSGQPTAPYAVAALAGPTGAERDEALRAVLGRADVTLTSVAAWVAGHARVTAALPELRRITKEQDHLRYALWARARLGDHTVKDELLSLLDALAKEAGSASLSTMRALRERARLLAVAAAELHLTDALPALKLLEPRETLDGCLDAVMACLRGGGTARFVVVHEAVTLLHSGIQLGAGQSTRSSCFSLETLAGEDTSLIHVHFFSGIAWGLRTPPHTFLATDACEMVLGRGLTQTMLPIRGVQCPVVVVVD